MKKNKTIYTIYNRTFEALKYPKGSNERIKLNGSSITSEYMKSYKYTLISNNYSLSFKTLGEAHRFGENIKKNGIIKNNK